MPKIIEYFGLIFYFYANEHDPIHVHVSKGEFESVFELLFENGILIEVKSRKVKGLEPLKGKDFKIAS